ncbi:unnamed protein product [Cuscuta campestris]|uniref:Uncharacterized protein n=1 Tax=Cuscuta campestris TaxID=132261 RepID=A0A484LJC1_9ASTE|nr:unnamed protein product [Cuscuta campestris]
MGLVPGKQRRRPHLPLPSSTACKISGWSSVDDGGSSGELRPKATSAGDRPSPFPPACARAATSHSGNFPLSPVQVPFNKFEHLLRRPAGNVGDKLDGDWAAALFGPIGFNWHELVPIGFNWV